MSLEGHLSHFHKKVLDDILESSGIDFRHTRRLLNLSPLGLSGGLGEDELVAVDRREAVGQFEGPLAPVFPDRGVAANDYLKENEFDHTRQRAYLLVSKRPLLITKDVT